MINGDRARRRMYIYRPRYKARLTEPASRQETPQLRYRLEPGVWAARRPQYAPRAAEPMAARTMKGIREPSGTRAPMTLLAAQKATMPVRAPTAGLTTTFNSSGLLRMKPT